MSPWFNSVPYFNLWYLALKKRGKSVIVLAYYQSLIQMTTAGKKTVTILFQHNIVDFFLQPPPPKKISCLHDYSSNIKNSLSCYTVP